MFKIKNAVFIISSIVFLILFSTHVLSQASPENHSKSVEKIPEYQIKRYQKDFELAFKQGTIKIVNHYGNVVIKNTKHHTVGLSAVVQEIGKQPAHHQLDIKTQKEKLVLEIKYPKKDIKTHRKSNSKFPIGRVDLVLFIPIDYKIDVETTFGKIDFKRVKNPIMSKSESGAINASSYFDMQAESNSGQIKAFPMGVQWNKGINLKSQSGDIYAIIPVKSNVELEVKTKGTVKSQLDSIKKWTVIDSKFKKSYGKNGKSYRIKSKNGAVYLSPHNLVK